MNFPAGLALPGMISVLIAVIVGSSLWDWNPLVATLVGIILVVLGFWLNFKLSDWFFKTNSKDSEK